MNLLFMRSLFKMTSGTLFVALAAVLVLRSAHTLEPRIIRGQPAIPGDYPFFVYLKFRISSSVGSCGGSLISDRFILTAAHCTLNADYAEAILGYSKIGRDDETQYHLISKKKFFLHPQSDIENFRNDIALLQLPIKVKFTPRIQPVKLSANMFSESLPVIAIGTGATKTQATDVSLVLRRAIMQTIPMHMCLQFFPFLESDRETFCAWSSKKSAIYRGDSGGPLVRFDDNTLYGIANFGYSNGSENGLPQVFTFAPLYTKWINRVTGLKL